MKLEKICIVEELNSAFVDYCVLELLIICIHCLKSKNILSENEDYYV